MKDRCIWLLVQVGQVQDRLVSCGTGLANAIIWVDRQAVEVGGLVSMMAWASMTSPSSTITLLGATSVTVQLHPTKGLGCVCGQLGHPPSRESRLAPSEHGQNKTHRSAGTDKDSSKNTQEQLKEGIGEPFGKAKSVEEFRGLFGAGIFGKTTNALQTEAKAQERFDVPHAKEL